MTETNEKTLRILSVGTMAGISNTCRLRNVALEKIAKKVDVINTNEKPLTLWYRVCNKLFSLGLPVHLPDRVGENRRIIELAEKNEYDLIWIDKGLTINGSTLRKLKKIQPQAKLVSYTPDNMAEHHNQSQNYLDGFGIYDYHITTKSYIIDDLYRMGAQKIIFSNQSYEESFHYPREIDENDMARLGADVGFVGMWEKERMDSILYLTRNGIKVKVFGDEKWNVCANDNANLEVNCGGLFNEDYVKSFKCFKISLCFLRKMNRDLQTTRTMEIPACGGFMLAERTTEHLKLFEEGVEAEYFDTDEELLEKCRYYLSHEDERLKIAEAGRKRCISSGYSNVETLRQIINQIMARENL